MDLNFSFLVSFLALTWSLTWSWRREKKTVKLTLPAYHQRTFHRIECLFPRPGFCFSASFLTLLSCHSSVMLIVLFSFLVFQGFDHFLFSVYFPSILFFCRFSPEPIKHHPISCRRWGDIFHQQYRHFADDSKYLFRLKFYCLPNESDILQTRFSPTWSARTYFWWTRWDGVAQVC